MSQPTKLQKKIKNKYGKEMGIELDEDLSKYLNKVGYPSLSKLLFKVVK